MRAPSVVIDRHVESAEINAFSLVRFYVQRACHAELELLVSNYIPGRGSINGPGIERHGFGAAHPNQCHRLLRKRDFYDIFGWGNGIEPRRVRASPDE